jgi:hypothetical protein
MKSEKQLMKEIELYDHMIDCEKRLSDLRDNGT